MIPPHQPISFRNKGTKEIFKDAGSMVLDAQKRYKLCLDLVHCDIECVVKDPDEDCWYILDECGNWNYFPSNEYEIIFAEEPIPERSQRLPPCPKCGAWTFSANIDAGHSLLCSNDACKWQQRIVAEPEKCQFYPCGATLGVGDGTKSSSEGGLFVHGSYESIKEVQRIILDREQQKAPEQCTYWGKKDGKAVCSLLISDPALYVELTDAIKAEAVRSATLAAYEDTANRVLSCVWSDAPDCPGTTNGEMICNGCERFEYANPKEGKEAIKRLLAVGTP